MQKQGPEPAFATGRVTALIDWMTARSRRQAAIAVVIGVAAIAVADYLTGPRVSVGPLNLLPMCLAAWALGARAGFVTGTAAAVLTILQEGRPGPLQPEGAMSRDLTAIWNAGMRVLVVAVVVMLVAGFRRAFEAERTRGNVDALTGAYSRQALNARIAATVALARRHKLTLVLAYADLEGFKTVNDTHGHAVGDDVLKTFASAASASIRKSDSLCRVGGDEFIILMTTASPARGYSAAEHLHARLSRIMETLPFEVTCSMGAVIFDGDAPADPQAFITYADALMYEVKKSGKNALRIAHAHMGRAQDQPPARMKAPARTAMA
ncbi:hypothetical protein BSL82_16540 [Tardibacter chloracetimidivorans]|uniref:GGDEF domain-containing protein n=1 Tax=Tardibacter chloracetimidivorans TaxID=1921510 RepID=A0A1L3ZYI7_9SPHN|nr:GGDEF domain-containing protein [Tardibacter chloracetimidivorans]API60698.1 hypothetical protein BSL82_16540 [Tardibacter chloracetimidivorans]